MKSVQKFLDKKYGHLSDAERKLAEEILQDYARQLPQQAAQLFFSILMILVAAVLLVGGAGVLIRMWIWIFRMLGLS